MEGGSLSGYTTRLQGGRVFGRRFVDDPIPNVADTYMLKIATSQMIQDLLAAYRG
jgi:hypothetical protein